MPDPSLASTPMNANVGLRLTEQAIRNPEQLGIATPRGSHRAGSHRPYDRVTLRDMDQRSSAIAAGFQEMGIGPGKRIALLVRFGEDFITLVFALLKCGATLVLIDPGMGRQNLLKCLAETEPDGFVAIPLGHVIVQLYRSRFPKAKLNVTVGSHFGFLPHPTLSDLEKRSPNAFRPPVSLPQDPAAIIFTTGSTGPPKGVLYTHQTFNAQIDMIASHYGIAPGGLDLSGFPLFGLFNAVMGTGTILPDMDPTRPADVDPVRLLDAIDQWQANQSFGSPALWTRIGSHCQRTGRRAPSLRRVLSAGAPVPPRVLEQIRAAMHPDGVMFTPYGATEALPIASIESRMVLEETAALTRIGRGTCVGQRFDGIRWRVIQIQDGPLTHLDQTRAVPQGEIGELMVSGPVVTQSYVTRTDQNALHKVLDTHPNVLDTHPAAKHDGNGTHWHRMGDVGYLDSQDRFWFCGRKAHRISTANGTLFTEPIEAIVNAHPWVYRSALVARGSAPHQSPAVIVEPWPEHRRSVREQAAELHQTWASSIAANLPDAIIDEFVVHPSKLPTDIRHNSKIFREKLAVWLASQRTR
jgi:olefin beta-lactone synthetase